MKQGETTVTSVSKQRKTINIGIFRVSESQSLWRLFISLSFCQMASVSHIVWWYVRSTHVLKTSLFQIWPVGLSVGPVVSFPDGSPDDEPTVVQMTLPEYVWLTREPIRRFTQVVPGTYGPPWTIHLVIIELPYRGIHPILPTQYKLTPIGTYNWHIIFWMIQSKSPKNISKHCVLWAIHALGLH